MGDIGIHDISTSYDRGGTKPVFAPSPQADVPVVEVEEQFISSRETPLDVAHAKEQRFFKPVAGRRVNGAPGSPGALSLLEKQAQLRATGLILEDPAHRLTEQQSEQVIDKLLDLKSRGLISKGDPRALSLATPTDRQGNVRVDRILDGLEKRFAPPEELREARRRLAEETGVTIADNKGLLTVEDEHQLIAHVRNTFGKHGIRFPPDTVVEIVDSTGEEKRVGGHDGKRNHILLQFVQDPHGDALLVDDSSTPRAHSHSPSPASSGAHSHDSEAMLRTLTHELGHQDDDANKSPDGLERERGGDETKLVEAQVFAFAARLDKSQAYKAYGEAQKNNDLPGQRAQIKAAIRETLDAPSQVVRDNIDILDRRLDSGELTPEDYFFEAGTVALNTSHVYGRIQDSQGRDLYNRAARHIENGKERARSDPAWDAFRKQHDPVAGEFPTGSASHRAPPHKYGATTPEEFYAHTMEHYVHDAPLFREQIARSRGAAASLTGERDRHSPGSREWEALNAEAKYARESAEILDEAYAFMRQRFQGREF